MSITEAALILTGLHVVTGFGVWWLTRRRRDEHWRDEVEGYRAAWSRLPTPVRKQAFERFTGGRDDAA